MPKQIISEQWAAIGHRIRLLRKRIKMRLGELARRTGYTKGTLSLIERGMSKVPLDRLCKIAEVLRVPVSVIITEHDLSDKKVEVLADFLTLCQQDGAPKSLEIIHTIIKAELVK